jgi:hypothetical protein
MNENQLLMGDIQVHTINNLPFPNIATYILDNTSINDGIISLEYDEFFKVNKEKHTVLNVFFEHDNISEQIYPDITWETNTLKIDLGFTPSENEKVYVTYNYK